MCIFLFFCRLIGGYTSIKFNANILGDHLSRKNLLPKRHSCKNMQMRKFAISLSAENNPLMGLLKIHFHCLVKEPVIEVLVLGLVLFF